jgi:hypothetical protein
MKKYSLASDIFHDDDESVEDNDSYIYTFNPEDIINMNISSGIIEYRNESEESKLYLMLKRKQTEMFNIFNAF